MSLPPLLTRYNFNFTHNFRYFHFTTLENDQKRTIKIIIKHKKWNNKWKLLSYFLGYFEELKFAKRTFKQNLRTRQISASFPCDSSVYHGNVNCWLKRPLGRVGIFLSAFPMIPCAKPKLLQLTSIMYPPERSWVRSFTRWKMLGSAV